MLQLLPILLMVTSSILLDCALRNQTCFMQRSQCQVWLWLAVAVSSTPLETHNESNDDSDTGYALVLAWSNATIFLNLLGIATEAMRGSSHAIFLLKTSAATEILRLMTISCWMVMIYSTIIVSEQPMAGSLLMYGILLAILITIRWHWKRQEQIRKETGGLPQQEVYNEASILGRFCGPACCCLSKSDPPTTMMGPSLQPVTLLDESQWYTWDRMQTMQWISRQFQASNGITEQQEDQEIVTSRLTSQRITGDVLDGLDVSELMQLQIPFGPACRLSRAIERLVQQFPKPSISDRSAMASQVSGPSWLSQHDREYNSEVASAQQNALEASERHGNNRSAANAVPHLQPDKPKFSSTQDGQPISEAEEDTVQYLMKERFGLELPTIHNVPQADANGKTVRFKEDLRYGEMRESEQTPQSSAPPRQSTMLRDHDSSPIAQDLLETMPPHIQEIAVRRPDLVMQLLKRRQRQLRQSASSEGTPMASKSTTRRTIQNSPDRDAGISDDSDDSDETTSLIQRDMSDHPLRYRSLEKLL